METDDADQSALIGSGTILRSDITKPTSIWKDTNWRQKLVLVYVIMMNYICSICFSSCSPFLARVVIEKGGTVLLSSIVLETATVTTAVFSIVFGRYQSRIGTKSLILSGLLLLGLCQIAFGAIGYFQNYWVLVAVGAVLRGVLGICQAASNVASLTIICQDFPDFVSTAFGLFESAYGAGFVTGPYLGGFLYDWSDGMMMPMAITGLLTLLFSIAGFGILTKHEDWPQDLASESHLCRILRSPNAVMFLGAAATLLGGFGLCTATISVYLKPEGFSATKVGQLLFLGGLSYCVFALIIGFTINSRKRIRRIVIIVGVLCGIAFPFCWIPNQARSWIYVAMVGYTMSTGLTLIPAFEELKDIVASDSSYSSDASLNSALSGLWFSTLSGYTVVISLVGSAMLMTLPYFISFVLSLLILLGFTILLALLSVLHKHTC